jgi:hypothetical protein
MELPEGMLVLEGLAEVVGFFPMDLMSRPPGLISVWFLEMDFGELRAPIG